MPHREREHQCSAVVPTTGPLSPPTIISQLMQFSSIIVIEIGSTFMVRSKEGGSLVLVHLGHKSPRFSYLLYRIDSDHLSIAIDLNCSRRPKTKR